MNELTLANRASDWLRLKALVLDSVSSPITRRVYNLGLDEFIAWYGQAPRPGFPRRDAAYIACTLGPDPLFRDWGVRVVVRCPGLDQC